MAGHRSRRASGAWARRHAATARGLATARAADRRGTLMTIWVVGRGIVGRRDRAHARGRATSASTTRDSKPTPLRRARRRRRARAPGRTRTARRVRSGGDGASVVTVGDGLDDTRELMALDQEFLSPASTLVIGAALTPGLSGLLARIPRARRWQRSTRSTSPCTARPARAAPEITTGR